VALFAWPVFIIMYHWKEVDLAKPVASHDEMIEPRLAYQGRHINYGTFFFFAVVVDVVVIVLFS